MAANFVTSLMTRLRGRGQKKSPDEKKKRRSCIVSWFSTSDLDNVDEDSSFLLDDSGLDVTSGPRTPSGRERDSGYMGSPGHGIMRKAESLSSLVRCTSIQDRSLKVTRKRRQNMAKRNRRNKYLSFKKAIFPDEGIDVTSGEGCTTDESSDEMIEPPSEKKVSPTEKRSSRKVPDVITRQNSVQKKSWEIRRRRNRNSRRSGVLQSWKLVLMLQRWNDVDTLEAITA
ncbi:uncharacterized protein LOC124275712 [Haliotis rubra]|uniref:uncharacterized protein LOC124275712 n=1 Tax=Haliotis rubra TaxID=36100 RepID=UPI001EE5578F|nr:uncharacterized protein LOC124275712 [Haliotis rubra]